MSLGFVVNGGKETADLNVTPLDLLVCLADTEESLDCLSNNWVCPWSVANIMLCIPQETEFFKETVS